MLERTPSEFSILNMHKPIRPGLERAPTSINLAKPLPRLRLDGKVALIIGGGGKVGVETAGRLMVEGANVALVDIDQPALEGAIGVLKAAIPTGVPIESRLLTMVADATIEADIEACVKKTLQRFDRLDIALLSTKYGKDSVKKTMAVNVKSGEYYRLKPIFDTSEANPMYSLLWPQARCGSYAHPG